MGYALGWNYWYNWAITVASELVAASLVMQYWFPNIPSILWSTCFLSIFVSFNAISAKGFGEIEYWFSFIKVTTIIIFIIAGASIVLGLHTKMIGFSNWKIGDAPFHNGPLAIFDAFIIAGFSFQGTELIGIAAGESENPRVNIPRAIKQVFWRILLFFVLSIFVISLLIPYNSTQLINASIETSPFTLVFKQIGISFAASLMNAVILIAILSAGNSGMYAATRMLWYLAKERHVPSFFARVNNRGVPIVALIATTAIALLAFLSTLYGNGRVYLWLLNASSLSGFIAWLGIAISHYRFRKSYIQQGRDLKDLPYIAKGYPYAPLIAFGLCTIVIAGQNYRAFTGSTIDWSGIIVSYIGIPLFVALWLGYKFIKKTRLVDLSVSF